MKWLDNLHNIEAKRQPTLLRFCTPTEQATINGIISDCTVDGGYRGAERKRAYLYTPQVANIQAFKIEYDPRFLTLTHSNILGSVMALSITYDSIGDILADQAILFVTAEIAEELMRSFTSINNVPITLHPMDGRHVERHQDYSSHEAIVSSLRIDQVVRHIAQSSRNDAQWMIQNDKVKINHVLVNKVHQVVAETDIISIRHHGRFVIDDTSQRTKKQKYVMKYRKYE